MRRVAPGVPARRVASRSSPPGPLLGIPALRTPSGFGRLASATVDALKAQVAHARALPARPARPLLRALDDVSHTLSHTLDTAELCRNVHPDAEWRDAADAAYARVSDFVHELNADATLHARAAAAAESGEALSEEEGAVLRSLLVDAHAGGVLAPPARRAAIVQLQQRAARLGARFAQLCAAPPAAPSRATDAALMHTSPLPNVRRAAYLTSLAPAAGAEACLDELLATRAELAQAVGEASYAHLALRSTVLRTPDAVQALLERVSAAVRPRAEEELAVLRAAKGGGVVHQWDRHYYAHQVRQRSAGAALAQLAQYLPLAAAQEALQLLVQRLFGLRLVPAPPAPGELWHASVAKLLLTDDRDAAPPRGVLYLDLLARPHKMPGAANFVLCNASRTGTGEARVPAVALVASFGASDGLLSHAQLDTLLHEAGHALACLLSRTDYQTVSGLRCAADWVEVPSTLAEHFAWDYRFVSLFARHHRTHAPLPADLWRAVAAQRHAFAALDLQEQLALAALDQALHGPAPLPAPPARLAHDLERRYTLFAPAAGTAAATRFTHLYNYPATYYAYLHARLVAAALWRRLLAPDPLAATAGRLLHDELLAFGGARDPRLILQRLVGGAPDVAALLDEIKRPP